MISIMSPLRSCVRSGWISPLMRAATHSVADVGMDAVGEVDRRRGARQRDDLALRREHVDLVGEQIDLDVLEELARVAGVALDLQQRLQPLVGARLQLRKVGIVVLVEPVGGDAGLGNMVHLARADLKLDRRAVRADQGRVQRLVAVDLRDRDVVLELARAPACTARAARPSRCSTRCGSRRRRGSRRCPAPRRTTGSSRASCGRCRRASSRGRRPRRAASSPAAPCAPTAGSCRAARGGCRARRAPPSAARGSAADAGARNSVPRVRGTGC